MGTLKLMVDVSAILFGVFGIWLGMFYNPGVVHEMNGKKGDELKDVAHRIIENARRFEIVFRGMKISACILVCSMFANFVEPFLYKFAEWPFMVKYILRLLLFSGVIFSVLAQSYSVLTSIAPMLDAKKRMDRAKDDAEKTLSL